MVNLKKIKVIYIFFTKKLLRSKKTKLFILLSMIPLLIFLIINGIKLANNDNMLSGDIFLKSGGIPFFFQLYVQLISLLFGAAVLSDEIDNKTLIYLNTSPVSKLTILTGKFASYLSISFLSFMIGSSILFIVTNLKTIISSESISTLLQLEFTGLISIIAYSSLFLMLAVSLKKSTSFGLLYIFGWETIAQLLPGATQKFTIFFYINSLTPIKIAKEKGLLNSNISQPNFLEALITLIVVSMIFFYISVHIFRRKEYLLADHT